MAGDLAFQMAVPVLHPCKGGCNGIGAWVFNSALNSGLLVFSMFHVGNNRLRRIIRVVITVLRGDLHVVSLFHFSRES